MIKIENGELLYFDKNGNEITEDSRIRYPDGKQEFVYRTAEGELGTDATNRSWIERGWASPCEHGIYPLTAAETDEVEVVKQKTVDTLICDAKGRTGNELSGNDKNVERVL